LERIFFSFGHAKRSIETNSSSSKTDAWHHQSDAITSVAAFTGITIALLMGKRL
jgi:divalent metal cation (Fe/Co/Zn/Cd) transporter